VFASRLLSRAGRRAAASLAEVAGGLGAAQRGEEPGGCVGCGDGAALGVVWKAQLTRIVSRRCHVRGCRQAGDGRHS